MGDPFTSTTTKIYIGPIVTADVDDVAAFAALTYTEIGLAESLGEFGDESATISFTALNAGRVLKLKGPRDAGSVALTVAVDPLDPGQVALGAAEASRFNFAFKIVYPDRPNPTGTDTEEYFRALVMSRKRNVGDAANVMRRSYPIGINSRIVEKLATMGT